VQLFVPLASLRFPVKAMVLAGFCWSILAGMGFDAWRVSEPASRRRWHWMVSVPVGLVVCACGAAALVASLGAERWGPTLLYSGPGFPSFTEALRPTASRLAIAAGLGGTVLALSVVRTRVAAAGTMALLVAALCIGDLLATHDQLNPLAPRSLYTHRPEVLDHLATSRHQRLYVRDHAVLPKAYAGRPRRLDPFRLARAPEGWSALAARHLGVQMYLNPPTAGRFGLEGSYDLDLLELYPASLTRLTEYLREREGSPVHLRLLQMGAVANALALHPEPWWQELRLVTTVPGLFEQPIHVFRVPEPLPRTYAVGQARLATGEAALAALADPRLDLRREVVLAEGQEMDGAADLFTGTSRLVELRPDRVRIEAELSRPGFVVLVDGYDPGWRAEIDGRAAPVLRANVAFRAVAVPAGRHIVDYRYRPTSIAVGAAISASALLLGLGYAALRLAR
jgi:hypothetical protein